jgi:hypothetical protein
MQFAIGQSNDNQFHRRLVGDDGTELAVSADSFASARETRSAATDVPCTRRRPPASDPDHAEHRRGGPSWAELVSVGALCDPPAHVPGRRASQRDRRARARARRNAIALPDPVGAAPRRKAQSADRARHGHQYPAQPPPPPRRGRG